MCIEAAGHLKIRKLPVKELECWKVYRSIKGKIRLGPFTENPPDSVVKPRVDSSILPDSSISSVSFGVSACLNYTGARYLQQVLKNDMPYYYEIGRCILKGDIWVGPFRLEALYIDHVIASEWGEWLS